MIFGAFFMLKQTMYLLPYPNGQIVFTAVLVGILTGLFRLFGSSAEGVSYAIILNNILVPTINNMAIPKKAFGREGK